jgi:hypothetical protein
MNSLFLLPGWPSFGQAPRVRSAPTGVVIVVMKEMPREDSRGIASLRGLHGCEDAG